VGGDENQEGRRRARITWCTVVMTTVSVFQCELAVSCVCVLSKTSSSSLDAGCSMPSSPLVNTERSLAVLLGLHAHYQLRSTAVSADERQYSHWLHAEFFTGGLQTLHMQNPYDEEKGESRTPTSCATTPG